jgi:hypothetical protein
LGCFAPGTSTEVRRRPSASTCAGTGLVEQGDEHVHVVVLLDLQRHAGLVGQVLVTEQHGLLVIQVAAGNERTSTGVA